MKEVSDSQNTTMFVFDSLFVKLKFSKNATYLRIGIGSFNCLHSVSTCLIVTYRADLAAHICDRSHRDVRWIDGLSHQSSNLSCLCYSLKKVVVCACSDIRLEWHKVVNYPANLQTT